uniref:Uncharacterized protein n=1 Tax=Rhizophora mucronata TaxID=61149 RepID=A0A2P2M7M8_RHIMU
MARDLKLKTGMGRMLKKYITMMFMMKVWTRHMIITMIMIMMVSSLHVDSTNELKAGRYYLYFIRTSKHFSYI